MPFKSKKHQFKGTPAWKLKAQSKENKPEPDFEENSSSQSSHKNSSFQSSFENSSFQSSCENSSSKSSSIHVESLQTRLSRENHQSCSVSSIDCNERSQGYRLIDISCLNNALEVVHQCPGARLTVIDTGVANGLCSTLAFMCLKCGVKTNWETSKRVKPQVKHHTPGGKLPFAVNRCAAYSVSEIGLGREGLATFCGIMGMPLPSDTTPWHSQIKAVNNAANSEFCEEKKQAALRLRRLLKIELENLDESFDPEDCSQLLDVAVSFDGTWHHRGFKSSHGVGVVMSIDTGEVLDVEVLSKDCSICSKNPNPDDNWKKLHDESGFCEKNCDGPSTSMETQAAKLLWLRSKENGLQYTTVLSDGDNKTLSCLNELRPYDEKEIQKLDCVNHVHKRMGAGLRSLVKTNKEVKGGKGGLTAKHINSMSSFYKKAIMDNVTDSKNSAEIEKTVNKMQIRILANLHHSVYHPDPSIQHKLCDSSWCPYMKDKKEGTTNYNHVENKKKRLPQSFLSHLLPLYERLSDKSLLIRCIGGLTQNQNEAFNATIWRRCPKERAFGAAAVRRAVHLASISWNGGKHCYVQMLNALGINHNHFTTMVAKARDSRRLAEAAKYAANKEERKRKIKEKNIAEITAKRQFGDDYQPGMF